MRRIISLLAALMLTVPALAQQTKTQLEADVATNFPDNTSGLITPQVLRDQVNEFIVSWQQAPRVNAQVGTTYTIQVSDYGLLITFCNASPVSVTLPQATGSFSTFNVFVKNVCAGSVTITPTVSTIDGVANILLSSSDSVMIVSNASNYITWRGISGGTGTVTSIQAGTCLTGGTITSTGTISVSPGCFQNYLSGLTISNDATSDITNEVAVAVGVAADSTNVDVLILGSAISRKKLNVAWAVGSNAGCLDTGAVSDTWYHIFIIKRTDTGVVDVLCSLSPSAPTMPSSYTEFRRIGSVVRVSGANKTFTQNGDRFTWLVGVHDIAAQNIGTTATDFALTTPTGVVTEAMGNACTFLTGATSLANFYPKFVTDQTVAYGSFANVRDPSAGSGQCVFLNSVLTNTSSQIRARGSAANVTVDFYTTDYIDSRGQ